jgi:acetylglutamate kinase
LKVLIKIGGTLLDDRASLKRLAGEIAVVAKHHQMVVVHGGGKQMTRFLTERGIESRFVNGLRVTTDEVLDAVLKIFAGSVNTTVVAALRAEGAPAVGLTGVDAGLVDAEPLDPELGHVGRPVHSNPELLNVLIGSGFLPVVACVAGDSSGAIYNVNGDQMAVACAAAFDTEKLIFLTDVDGVRDGSGCIRAVLGPEEALDLIRCGAATGGMQAKLEAALSHLSHFERNPLAEIRICSGSNPDIVQKILSGSTVGTRLAAQHG